MRSVRRRRLLSRGACDFCSARWLRQLVARSLHSEFKDRIDGTVIDVILSDNGGDVKETAAIVRKMLRQEESAARKKQKAAAKE